MSQKKPANKHIPKKPAPQVKKPVSNTAIKNQGFGKKEYLFVFALLAAIFVIYLPSLDNQFINYDDDLYIQNHPLIQDFKFSHIGKMFSEFYGAQYAPIPFVMYGIVHMIGGYDPSYYVITGIFLHLTVTLLVFIFIRSLTGKFNVALLTAALFGIATTQVESVTWLSAVFKTGTYALFFMASLISYLKYARTQKIKYAIFSLILFVCSCFCKEQAVALPLALIVLDLYLKRKIFSGKVILEKIPFFLVSLIFGYITMKATGSNKEINITDEFSFGDRIVYASYALVWYFIKMIVPYKLSLFYPYPSPKKLGVMLYVFPFILTGILALYFWAIKRKKDWIVFGGLFFLVSILFSLALQIISVREVVMADRYVYVSSIGFYFILAYGAIKLCEKFKISQAAIYGIFAIYLAVIGYQTSKRTKVWHDTLAVTTDVLNNFESPVAYLNRGYYYRQQKQYDKALVDYTNAIRVNPKYALAYQNRGVLYFMSNKDSLALADYNKSLEIDSNVAEVYANRGAVYARTGKIDLALKDFAKALSKNPEQKDALNNRSLVYYQMGKYKESIADLDEYLRLFPTEGDSYNLRALAKTGLEDYEGALKDYNLALQYKPNDGLIYQNRSYMYFRKGDKVNALKDAQQAQKMGVKLDPVYLNALK